MAIRFEDYMNSLPQSEQDEANRYAEVLKNLPPLTPEGIVAYAAENGIVFMRCSGGLNFPKLCARHALIYSVVGKYEEWNKQYNVDTADAYGITVDQLLSIDRGFEGCEYYEDYDLEYWELGRKIYELSRRKA
jgi:hypothetical protein